MIRSISRRWWLGLLGLVWLGMSGSVHAQNSPLVKFSKVRFNVNVEMSTLPTVPPPTAPWYAYFPTDARTLPSMQASPYPSWPMQFPPPGRPADAPQKRSSSANVAQGPMLTQHWPSYSAYGSNNLQPVGFVPAQAPSYWFQGR